jgi:formylmethanofuran dehydrogenase subunit E
MVGRRLREILDGRSRTGRKGERTIKVYEFDPRKVFRVAKKYGYSLVSELLMLPIPEGVEESEVVSESVSEEQQPTPQRISNISNMVTIDDIIDVQMTVLMDPYEKNCGVCGRLSMTRRNAKTKNRPNIPICETCAQEYFRFKAGTGA